MKVKMSRWNNNALLSHTNMSTKHFWIKTIVIQVKRVKFLMKILIKINHKSTIMNSKLLKKMIITTTNHKAIQIKIKLLKVKFLHHQMIKKKAMNNIPNSTIILYIVSQMQ